MLKSFPIAIQLIRFIRHLSSDLFVTCENLLPKSGLRLTRITFVPSSIVCQFSEKTLNLFIVSKNLAKIKSKNLFQKIDEKNAFLIHVKGLKRNWMKGVFGVKVDSQGTVSICPFELEMLAKMS